MLPLCSTLRGMVKRVPAKDVDVDGVYERRPRPLCPPHL